MMEARILVIDDEEVICSLIKDALGEKGYSVVTFQEVRAGLGAAQQNAFDAIFVDLRMPGVDGMEALKQIKQYDADNVVIMITGFPSFETVRESLHLGAFDYIAKPFDLEELVFTTRKAVTFRRLTLENKGLLERIRQENITLEKMVLEKTEDLRRLYRELHATYMSTIKALAQAIDAKDHYTHSHSEKVTKYALMIAKEMGLTLKETEEIKEAFQLHDLGKIGIHDYILAKPGKLTPEEWEEVKLHSLKGAEILQPLEFLDGITDLIRQHHERYDGKGYPYGLKEDAIKTGAKIIALADAFDAMVSERPYRQRPLTKEEAVEEIKQNAGSQFAPEVVKAFLNIVNQF